ncbi:hypothetical protein FWK35_00018695 [Aphis craccivora]|uniref:Uncharacterized protein n=1 Tax=Aphis craccivora TaxID=307492 RepID=A0A6G0Y1Z5_APHCR|nr:hypothetical protein FWK35_00018695 [Aphis craccivora]
MNLVGDCERSDECIGFTMLCVFFCLYSRERVENMLQFQTLEKVFNRKMNLVGALWRSSNFYEICRKRENLQRT